MNERAAEELRRMHPSLRVWVGRSFCFDGEAVLYSGSLTSCEAAERTAIPVLSRLYPGSKYCYVYVGTRQ